MTDVIAFVTTNQASIYLALFFLSEILALVPAIKANSIFQLVFGWIKGKKPAQPAE